jgi:hypothetical protein
MVRFAALHAPYETVTRAASARTPVRPHGDLFFDAAKVTKTARADEGARRCAPDALRRSAPSIAGRVGIRDAVGLSAAHCQNRWMR